MLGTSTMLSSWSEPSKLGTSAMVCERLLPLDSAMLCGWSQPSMLGAPAMLGDHLRGGSGSRP